MSSELRSRSYFLKCKVHVIRPYVLTAWMNRRETVQVLLIPQESDQKTFWQSAWVPPTEFDTYEALANVGSPFNIERARVGSRCADEKYKREPYLLVMDKELEELLVNRHKQTLMIQVLPESADAPQMDAPPPKDLGWSEGITG